MPEPKKLANLSLGLDLLRKAAHSVEGMREAVGDRVDIMLDFHARTTPAAGEVPIRSGRGVVLLGIERWG